MTEPRSAERIPEGVRDTCVLIDLDAIDDSLLPVRAKITTVALAELGLGIAVARNRFHYPKSRRSLPKHHSFAALPVLRSAFRRTGSTSAVEPKSGLRRATL